MIKGLTKLVWNASDMDGMQHIHYIQCPDCRNTFEWRCDEQFPLLLFREFIRKNCPDPELNEGWVVLDFDLIVRIYGTKGRDQAGTFKLLEVKMGNAVLKGGQKWTFRLIDQLLTRGDILGNHLYKDPGRYEGFYEIWCSTYDWHDPECRWKIEGIEVSREQLIAFLNDDKEGFPNTIRSRWTNHD